MRPYWMKYLLQDEATDGATGGGGSGTVEGDITVDIEAASDAIGADLGLNDGEGTDVLLDGSATPPPDSKKEPSPSDAGAAARVKAEAATKLAEAKKALTERKVDFAGKADADVLKLAEEALKAAAPQVRALPKAWKKDLEPVWAKLPPEAQNYIEQREAQVEDGFKAQGEAVNYSKSIREVFAPYEALLTSQGAPNQAVVLKSLLHSHQTLSVGTPEQKANFIAGLCKTYGVDAAAAAAAFAKDPAAQMTAAERELKGRLDALENERKTSQNATFAALKADSEREVAAFAADPKNPYFEEVSGEVALFLRDPKIGLAKAYEMAVYANPVTRAKELARLEKEAGEKVRADAEAKAAAAEKARGTRIRGKEEEKASPDLLGSIDDTMRETLKNIKSRQEG